MKVSNRQKSNNDQQTDLLHRLRPHGRARTQVCLTRRFSLTSKYKSRDVCKIVETNLSANVDTNLFVARECELLIR